MRYLFVVLLSAVCSYSLSATLSPGATAPAYSHLAEVNERWLHEVGPASLLYDTTYTDESARIRHHLLAVYAVLSARDVSSLEAKQASARAASIMHLREYAERGRFPINTGHSKRTPYFVDGDGTHCAVGYLLHRAGDDKLVKEIRSKTNNGYVLGDLLTYPRLEVWATEHGFTAEELAWIQPAYPGTYLLNAQEFGSGMGIDGGQVLAAAVLGDAVYLAGDFTHLDGIEVEGLARMEGDVVTALADAPERVTSVMAVPDTDLLVYVSTANTDGAVAVGVYDAAADAFTVEAVFDANSRVYMHTDGSGKVLLFVGAMQRPDDLIEVYTLSPDDYSLTPIASNFFIAGVIHDSYALGSTVTLGGEFVVRDLNGEAIDSNHVRYDVLADQILTDNNQFVNSSADDVLRQANLPVHRFVVVETGRSQYFEEVYARGEHLVLDEARDSFYLQSWSQTYAIGSPETATIEEYRNTYARAFEMREDVSFFFTERSDFTGNNDLIASGHVSPRDKEFDDEDDTRLIVRSLAAWSYGGYFYERQIPINGHLTALAQLDNGSLLLAGTFDSLAGAPIRHLAIARPQVSDAGALSAPEFDVYYSASTLHLDLGEALIEEAQIFLYATDGRLLQRLPLPAGQSTYQVPVNLPAGAIHYAIRTAQGTAAGSVLALDN